MKPVSRSGIVLIYDEQGGVGGTGFFAANRSNDALILTCSHVVQTRDSQRRGDPRPERVTVALASTGATCIAVVVPDAWRAADEEDVAILRVEGGLPNGAERLPLGSSAATYGHRINTFGYPPIEEVRGVPGIGEVLDRVDEAGHARLVVQSSQITTGYSGAPAWDDARNRVIGVIDAVFRPDDRGQLRGTVLITPSETYSRLCEDLQPSDVCPYVGLEPFDENHADVFKGRERIIGRLIDRLKQGSRFVALLGPSGCGKTSLIRAGLIPTLRTEAPRLGVIVAHPGTDPAVELEKAGFAGARGSRQRSKGVARAERRQGEATPRHRPRRAAPHIV